MKRIIVLVGFALLVGNTFGQGKWDAWNEFAKTKFEPKYYEKLGEYLFYPNFPEALKAMVGKEVTVEGFYVPFAPEDGNYIIISKFPQSQCFFCGGGGPESVVEIYFAKGDLKFQVDDLIKVKGKLSLNSEDYEHMPFILKETVLISK